MSVSPSSVVSVISLAKVGTLCLPTDIDITETLQAKVLPRMDKSDYLGFETIKIGESLLSFFRRYRRDCQCQNMDGQGRSRENILCLHRVQLQSEVEKRCGKARGAAPFELEHSLPLPLWQHIFQQN